VTTIRGYKRLSRDELLKTSPETQEKMIVVWRDVKHPGVPIVWYEDLGFSGGDWERPDFQRLFDESQPRDIAAFSSDDRFARDVDLHRHMLKKFREKGVEVVFLNMQIDTSTATGKFASTVSAAAAEQYREVIAEKTQQAVPTVRGKHIRWGRWPDLFEVVDEDGRKIVRPSQLALDLLARKRKVGPYKAAREFGVSAMKVDRLERVMAHWQGTQPWYTSARYDEHRTEYAEIKRIQRERDAPRRA